MGAPIISWTTRKLAPGKYEGRVYSVTHGKPSKTLALVQGKTRAQAAGAAKRKMMALKRSRANPAKKASRRNPSSSNLATEYAARKAREFPYDAERKLRSTPKIPGYRVEGWEYKHRTPNAHFRMVTWFLFKDGELVDKIQLQINSDDTVWVRAIPTESVWLDAMPAIWKLIGDREIWAWEPERGRRPDAVRFHKLLKSLGGTAFKRKMHGEKVTGVHIKKADVRPDRSNPAKKASSSKSGVIMGRLAQVVVRAPDGTEAVFKPKGALLGWIPQGKQLVVLKDGRRGQGLLSVSAAKIHRQFHNVDPTRADLFEWPDPVGRKRDVGKVVSLLYTIPPWLRSPEKDKYRWNHEFGDHGERGHGPVRGSGNYPEKYMPTLQVDDAGNLYFKRNPGNKYYVTDWLYW